jgi:integrase
MARTIRDSKLETRAARSRLEARGKPYFRAIEEGLHLGYRKGRGRPGRPATAGKWVVRRYIGGQDYRVETLDGSADDFSDADGVAILSFQQAQQKAREMMVGHAHATAKVGPYTVADAMDAYLKHLESEGRSAAALTDARNRDRAFIRPKLGAREVENLTATALRDWRDAMAKAPPRLRTKAGGKQNHREQPDDDNARRARRATTNRNWTLLRAALNLAFEREGASSDAAWRKVKPFRGVETARVRYLQVAEATRLVNATAPDFRPMVHAALLTGGRYGQLARLTIADFNGDAGTVTMRTRKGDGTEKAYHVHLTDEGRDFFRQMCSGRAGPDLIFKKADGSAWDKSHQTRPMAEACERAKISPPATFHCTRHTYASLAVMNGAPLLVVAQNLGHSDTRMVEKHYANLAQSYVADQIRAAAPKFGIKVGREVATIDSRKG